MNTTEVTCRKCGGSGFIPRYGHTLKGVCFKCNGAGKVRVQVRKDGQRADQAKCEHMLHMAYLRSDTDPELRICSKCGLHVDQWPTVVPAHWWGDQYVVYLPSNRQEVVKGEDRRALQSVVRALVAEQVPNFRIKWINR